MTIKIWTNHEYSSQKHQVSLLGKMVIKIYLALSTRPVEEGNIHQGDRGSIFNVLCLLWHIRGGFSINIKKNVSNKFSTFADDFIVMFLNDKFVLPLWRQHGMQNYAKWLHHLWIFSLSIYTGGAIFWSVNRVGSCRSPSESWNWLLAAE